MEGVDRESLVREAGSGSIAKKMEREGHNNGNSAYSSKAEATRTFT